MKITRHACVEGDEEVPYWEKIHPWTSVLFSYMKIIVIQNPDGEIHVGATYTK